MRTFRPGCVDASPSRLTAGVSAAALRKEGQILGHVGKDDVLVVQVGHEILAVGARCTHYRGPLAARNMLGRRDRESLLAEAEFENRSQGAGV